MKAITTAGLAGIFIAGMAFGQAAADNTKMNKGDDSKTAVTAGKQKMNADDRKLTQQIRKSLMDDKALSTYAHNVKIVSQNGTVTLRGPVHSEDEKSAIAAKAVEAAGSADKVNNQITIKPETK